ncbi:hypothetical protein RHMOL_Rhmol10G0079600 [Rhododendron molle]|uniref:Uncharacterized protein n=1 Tax=Rhododendron molle TaxID=49168 RepID=A0ACC0M0L2_RHOML|nr:hypothetical protein RHMOL_Rhmol10G0079600 [Rhododendron molle]
MVIVIYGGVADEGGVSGGSRGMTAVVNGVMVVVVMWCGDANCGIVGDAEAVWWTGVMGREMVGVQWWWWGWCGGCDIWGMKIPPSWSTYNNFINACGSSGNWRQALQVCQMMTENGVGPDLVKIVSILSAAELRGIALNTIAYNSAIGSYMNVGDYEKAIELYRSMRKKKVKPDSVTYTMQISGGCKMSKYIEAIGFLDEMMGLKIPWSKEGRFTEAESTFTTMKVAGCSPDVVKYTTMIHTYTAVGDWEKAVALLEEMGMNNVQPDAIAFSAMLLRDCIWSTTTKLIKMMEPSFPVISVGVLNQLLLFIGKSGKIETMMMIFLKIVATGGEISVSTYSILFDCFEESFGCWKLEEIYRGNHIKLL